MTSKENCQEALVSTIILAYLKIKGNTMFLKASCLECTLFQYTLLVEFSWFAE